MMFLEFFIWGCWFVTMGTFLSQAFSSSGAEIGLAYETQSWGAIIAPFIIGCLLYTSPSPRDGLLSRMPSSA